MIDTRRPIRAPRARRSAIVSAEAGAILDQEERMVREAILLVSRGGSRRVTVAGLRYADQVLEASRSLAGERRVRLVSLPTDDERPADVAVEAVEMVLAANDADCRRAVRTLATARAPAGGGV